MTKATTRAAADKEIAREWLQHQPACEVKGAGCLGSLINQRMEDERERARREREVRETLQIALRDVLHSFHVKAYPGHAALKAMESEEWLDARREVLAAAEALVKGEA